MGFFRDFFLGPAASVTSGLLSWHSPQDSIQSLLIADALPVATDSVTRDVALRVPAVKRAHDLICGVIADMPWFEYDGDTRTADQPRWLTTSDTGLPPRDLRWGITSDLFMSGWAAIGFKLNGGVPVDALHIPKDRWWADEAGLIHVRKSAGMDAYLGRVVAIRLGYGSNGMLVDALSDILDAIGIRDAYRDRIKNPIALTMLTLAAERWDMWSKEEREEFRRGFIAARSSEGGATGLKPDWVSVDTAAGQLPTDLFESGRNGNRLDLANHAGLPASILEGVRQGGSGGGTDIKYSGVQNGAQRSEIWDYGIAKYASAIAARLSLDDVCAPGRSIRVDTSAFLTVPTPTEQQTSED